MIAEALCISYGPANMNSSITLAKLKGHPNHSTYQGLVMFALHHEVFLVK